MIFPGRPPLGSADEFVTCKSAMIESPLTRNRLQMIGLIPSRTALS